MKLPQVYADVNVSADSPHRGIPAAAFQSGLGAAGIELARGAEEIGRIYEKKQRQDDSAEAIYLQSQAELALQQSDYTRKQTATDGATYLEDTRKDLHEVLEQTAARAKNPGAARLLRSHMSQRLVTLDRQALTHAADLTKKSEVAQLNSTLTNLNQQLAATDYTDTAEIARLNALKAAAIDVRAATLGLDDAQKLTEVQLKKTTEEIAYRHAHNDPADFLMKTGRYRGMDGKTLDSMVTGAEARIESDRKSHNVEMEKYYDRIDKEAEGERQGRLIGLRDRANKGQLTITDLDNERAYRTFATPAEYEVLHKVVTEEPKQTPSDPQTLTWVQLRTRSATPRITESALDSLFTAGKLNRKDWEEEKGKLISRQDHLVSEGRSARGEARTIAGEQRTVAGEGRSIKSQNVTQAEQVLKAGLGLHAPQDKWDLQDGQLYALALDELTGRAFEGNEKAIDVVREIVQRYAPIRQERIKLDIENYKRTLPQVLRTDQADKAMKLLDELRKSGMGSGTADAYRQTILNWKRIETYGSTKPGAPATPAATPAAPTSGAKPLRPAGTRAESGVP